MPFSPSNLLTRDDTFFGVCEALGEDFGFNPNYLRVALGVSLLLSPAAVLGGYALAGVAVAVSRLIAPNPRRAFAAASAGEHALAAPPAGDNDSGAALAQAA